jgi:tRNA (guanine-N7-)-methyltransferase
LRPSRPAERDSVVSKRREDLRQELAKIIHSRDHFVWEVGSGHGHFLTAFAKGNPGATCIGIDITSDRIVRADRKRERARLENLRFVRADADDFLAVMPETARFTSIFILFPDPWPKRRHHKNRVVKAEFLTAAAAKAMKGAPLYFRTDHEPYFRTVCDLVAAHADWAAAGADPWPFEEPTVFQKRAERHFSLVATRR